MRRCHSFLLPRTIQASLFTTYSLIIGFSLGIFVASFYFWENGVLRDRALQAMSETAIAVSDRLENEIHILDTVSLNILYSEDIRDQFFNTAHAVPNSPEKMTISRQLNSMLYAVIGPNHLAQQIYLYNESGTVFGTGLDNRERLIDLNELPWHDAVLRLNGVKYVSDPLSKPELSKFATSNRSAAYISLCRIFPNRYAEPEGILEVVQYYGDIFAQTDNLLRRNANSIAIRVYNERGVLMYPLDGSDSKLDEHYLGILNGASVSSSAVTNPFTHVPELLKYVHSDYTGWTALAIADQRKVLKPVLDFTLRLILLTTFVLLFALFLSFLAARTITVPIAHLRDAVRAVRLVGQEAPADVPFESRFEEIGELKNAFDQMNRSVRTSPRRMINSKEQEMHARMLALQSQMNPHFLYNVLSNISAMAEDGMQEQVVTMSASVSRMLRYISSDTLYETLEHEIDHVRNYLETMRTRYGGKLRYDIRVDEAILHVPVPKLVIQPLVENALKYATGILPPWNIEVRAVSVEDGWNVLVSDTGPGFDPVKLEQLKLRMREIDDLGMLHSFEIEGMGILNVYMRLRLAYGKRASFHIETSAGGGTSVSIGGSLSAQSESEWL